MSDVYVRITRPEGYEDVHSDLVIEDAAIHAEFEYENVTDEIERLTAVLDKMQMVNIRKAETIERLQARVEALEAGTKDLRLRLRNAHSFAISTIIDCELVPGLIPEDEVTGLAATEQEES